MCLLYRDSNWADRVIPRAEKAAATKSLSVSYRSSLRFLIAVLRGDPVAASTQLQEFMDGFRKTDWLHDYHHPLSKFCPGFAYGLYFAARHFLDEPSFKSIDQPNHFLWNDAYIEYCAANGFRAGKNVIDWRDEIAFVNHDLEDLQRWQRFPGGPRSNVLATGALVAMGLYPTISQYSSTQIARESNPVPNGLK